MNSNAIFGTSALLALLGSATLAKVHVWPRLQAMPRDRAIAALIAPHLLLRFVGLSFLVPGVVSPSLPRAFAVPAAYGDLAAGLLAVAATIALRRRAPGATLLAWAFNAWGAADLLVAFGEGLSVHLDPGALGAAYFIPTALVPPLLVTHFLAFRILAQRTAAARRPGRVGATSPGTTAA